jgi:hypothetical protein
MHPKTAISKPKNRRTPKIGTAESSSTSSTIMRGIFLACSCDFLSSEGAILVHLLTKMLRSVQSMNGMITIAMAT